MKVLHLSAHNGSTGGGLSAARIHRGLLARGVESSLCVAFPTAALDGSFTPRRTIARQAIDKLLQPTERWLMNRQAVRYEGGINSGFLGYNVGSIVRQHKPDIVQLHWL